MNSGPVMSEPTSVVRRIVLPAASISSCGKQAVRIGQCPLSTTQRKSQGAPLGPSKTSRQHRHQRHQVELNQYHIHSQKNQKHQGPKRLFYCAASLYLRIFPSHVSTSRPSTITHISDPERTKWQEIARPGFPPPSIHRYPFAQASSSRESIL